MLLAFAPAAYNRLQRWLHKTCDGRGLAAVTDIVITHMHMDHVGGLNVDGVKAKLRPDVPGVGHSRSIIASFPSDHGCSDTGGH